MMVMIAIIGISALFVGVAMGYWFAHFTKVIDLTNQKAQLKARCEALQELVDYYEGKGKEGPK